MYFRSNRVASLFLDDRLTSLILFAYTDYLSSYSVYRLYIDIRGDNFYGYSWDDDLHIGVYERRGWHTRLFKSD